MNLINQEKLSQQIFTIREQKVMLDSDFSRSQVVLGNAD